MAEILPFDLITIILLRLPVVDLLRCRSVSKHWRYFIDQPHFIRRHLSHSSLSRRNQTLFLRHLSSLRTVDLDSLGSSAPVLEEVNYPLMCYSDQIKLLGSCNGLICLSNAADDIIIWNPSLRKHRFLPYSNVKPRKDRGRPLLTVCVYGFGFEVKSDDYRLLRLVQFISDPCEFNISLYSLRTNKWRKIEEIPYSLVYPRKMGVFVSGALHWVMTPELVPESPNLIVGFNLEFEKFNQVPQPDTTLVSDFDMDVAVLEDCLCMVANSVAGTDVWMMKEYGSKESWVKLFSIPETIRCKRLLLPVALSDGGRQVLLRHDNKKLYSYDIQSESVTSVHIRGIPSSFDAQVCMRSLVSVDDYREDVKKKKGGQDGMAAGRKRDDFLSVGFKLVL